MNTLRIVLIIAGILFVLGLVIYLNPKYQLFRNSTKTKSIFLVLFNFLFEKIHIGLLKVKQYLGHLFVADEPVYEDDNRQQRQEALSQEQLIAMSNMVASKNKNLEVEQATTKPFSKSDSIQDTSLDLPSIDKNDNKAKKANQRNNKQRKDNAAPLASASKEELLVCLTVLPKPGEVFTGTQILSACKSAGLQLGEFDVFHRYALVDNKVLMTPVCSLVNLFEPGVFQKNNMDNFETEGLSLFMQLPGPVDGRDAFLVLMDVSEKLSLNLNATICDETRSVLTTQTISHLKEKVENFRFKLKMDALKNKD